MEIEIYFISDNRTKSYQRQVLIVPIISTRIINAQNRTGKKMNLSKKKEAFSERFNKILDLADVPRKGCGRQSFLAEQFSVSSKAARKWTEGESIPTQARLIVIVEKYKRTGVTVEWLLTGNPIFTPERLKYGEENQTVSLIKKYNQLSLVNFSELTIFLDSTNKNLFKTVLTDENASEKAYMLLIESDEFEPYVYKDNKVIIEPVDRLESSTTGKMVLVVLNDKIMIMRHQMHETDYLYPTQERSNPVKVDDIEKFQVLGYISRRISSKDG